MPEKRFLNQVYKLRDVDEVAGFYDNWSASYDAEVTESGYATPRRCAEALAAHMTDRAAPVLDFGCGTGLGGLALRAEGFETVDGMDLSADMLERARGQEGLYRSLRQTTLDDPLPVEEGSYRAVFASGVFSPNHAPPELLDAILRKLPSGGYFVFSLNDHAMSGGTYDLHIREWTDTGAARILLRDYGDHLPGIGVGATIYLLQKA